MDDLISRAAALDVLVTSPNFHTTLTRIEELHAVDAVPVVRCKDCMYFRPWRHDRGEDSRCEFWNAEIGAEDYCSQAVYLNNGGTANEPE